MQDNNNLPTLKNVRAPNLSEVKELLLVEEGYGRWNCSSDSFPNFGPQSGEPAIFYNVLEVHKAPTWNTPSCEKKALVRVSEYSKWNGVSLQECVLLNKDQMEELRDLLDSMIHEIELDEEE